MSTTTPSLAAVQEATEALAPPGTPLTTAEVAAEFDCTDRTVYNKLDALVDSGVLETKKVGARARVWWQPPTRVGREAANREDAAELDREPTLLNRILNVSPVGIAVVEADGEISLANHRAEEILGLTRDEITSRTYRQPEWEICYEDGTPISVEEHPVTRVFETGDPVFGFQHRIELRDGTERWLSSNSAPLRDETGDVERVVVGLEDITALRDRGMEITKQRDELGRLNRINSVIRSVVRALVSATSREEIEREVCERLATSEPYLFTVTGKFSSSYDEFDPRAFAGIGEDYLDAMLNTEDAPPLSEGIAATAARTQEVQAVQQLSDLDFDFWQETAHEKGFQSYASIPLFYEDVVYGVLGVYASRPEAFDENERAVLQELGETIGHAINAIESKEALLAETVVELELREDGALAGFFDGVAGDSGGIGEINQTVLLENGDAIQYYTVTGMDGEAFQSALEQVPSVEHVRLLHQDDGVARFEVRTSGQTMANVFAIYGGQTKLTRFEDGEIRVTAELPFGADIREVIEGLQAVYPDMEFASRRTRERQAQSAQGLRDAVIDRLTDRQRTVLEAAYAAGFFEWPRDSTGDDLAASLDVAPPTFHKHLRVGEAKIMAALFEKA